MSDGNYTLKKNNLYLGEDGGWYPIADIEKIKFYTAYVTASQDAIKIEAVVTSSTDILKGLLEEVSRLP